MLDLRQTPEYANFMKSLGWIVEGKSGSFAYIKKFSFLGSFIKIQRPETIDFEVIKSLSKKHRAFQIVLEPKSTKHGSRVTNHGFRQMNSYYVPSKTIQIDLTKPESQLLKRMHYKTRYNIKKVMSYELRVVGSGDISQFADFWQSCALKQRGMFLNQKKEITGIYNAFGKNAKIIFVKQKENLLAGILMICTKDTAYYMYAASSSEGKKLFAPTLAAWETIKLAKKLKKYIFDFEGIFDERFPIMSWKGFTRFKKSFGGQEVEYPGSFTKYRLPI